jgi:DNA-binding NtrC family response regulator
MITHASSPATAPALPFQAQNVTNRRGSTGTIDDSAERDIRPAARSVPYLVLGLECDRPTVGGARYSLDRVACATVGRGDWRAVARREEAGSVFLDLRVPAPAMSTSHARLLRTGDEWVIEDSGSTNGTFVNGARVLRSIVGEGDVIRLGRTVLLVAPALMTQAGSPADADSSTLTPDRPHVTLDPTLKGRLDALARVAQSEVSVLFRGETGTGKELVARGVHESSGRPGPFVAVNCGAIPANLVESHLFGHIKGAFSGALQNEPGVFRAANGGTLFLDEVGDLPPPCQVALLRALQEREVVPVGATRPVKVNARVVAATHQPLEAMAASSEFRRDLLARLAGFTLELPPLRARRLDLGGLIASLLRKLAPARADAVRFSPAAAEALFRHDWPLNIRELEQCLASALALTGDQTIDVAHLPAMVTPGSEAQPDPVLAAQGGLSTRDARIRLVLLEELARHGGNLAEVGRAMGKARMQVHRWCVRFGIDPNLYRRWK